MSTKCDRQKDKKTDTQIDRQTDCTHRKMTERLSLSTSTPVEATIAANKHVLEHLATIPKSLKID